MYIIQDILRGWIAALLVLAVGCYRFMKVLLSLIQLTGAVVTASAACLFGETIGIIILSQFSKWSGESRDKESSDL